MPDRRKFLLLIVFSILFLPFASHAQQPSANFTILLTNDDGYNAPGIQALVKAFAGYGDIYIAAPAQNQSGKGHSITTSDVIYVYERKQPDIVAGYAIDAPPATCTRLGLEKYLPKKPDLVISGINAGENLGLAVYLSGTLGAAREAVFSDIPAIAVSQQILQSNRLEDYAATAAYVRELVEQLRAKQMLKPGFFLNVNAPAREIKGVRLTRVSTKESKQFYQCSETSRGRKYCFSDYEQVKADDDGTDVQAFFQGFVTLSPMTLDVTDAKEMKGLRSLEKKAAAAAAN